MASQIIDILMVTDVLVNQVNDVLNPNVEGLIAVGSKINTLNYMYAVDCTQDEQ